MMGLVKKAIGLLLILMIGTAIRAQGLKEIFIECDPNDLNNIYENYQEDIYIPASLTYNGETWNDVLLRIRGDSSRDYPKKSLKAEFSSEPFIDGRTELNFNADYHDLSYMHSVLSSILFKKAGLECAEMEHVRLYMNGDFFGLYILTENVDAQFLTKRNYDPDGTMYKASLDGACLSIHDNVFYHWELKNGEDPLMDNLSQLIWSLNYTADASFPDFIQQAFSFVQLKGFISMNMLLSNGSTYYHNYYLYKNPGANGKWTIFPWDLDRTFSDYSIWYDYHRSSGEWTPDNPMLERTIMNEGLLYELSNKITDFKNSFFNTSFLFPIMDSLKYCIQNSVLEDTTDNIPDLETWLTKIESDKDFVENRYNQLDYQISHYPRNFRISRLSGYFQPGENITFQWLPSVDPNDDPVSYSFHYSKNSFFPDTLTTVIPNIVATQFSTGEFTEEGNYYWKVKASNGSSAIEGFDAYNILFIAEHIPTVVINEINYNSESGFDPGDWLELFNNEAETIDLSGWFMSDNNNAHRFYFPEGTVISAKGYLVVCESTVDFYTLFPDTIKTAGDLGFGLSSNGELLRLYNPITYLVDSLVYRSEFPWPSGPNGDGQTLELINPTLDNSKANHWSASVLYGTPGQQNSSFSPETIPDHFYSGVANLLVSPNPFNHDFVIQFDLKKPGNIKIVIYDLTGKQVTDRVIGRRSEGHVRLKISADNLPSGLYKSTIYVDGKYTGAISVMKKAN